MASIEQLVAMRDRIVDDWVALGGNKRHLARYLLDGTEREKVPTTLRQVQEELLLKIQEEGTYAS